MFDDAGDRRKPLRQRFWLGNMLQLGVEEPVPAIRDQRMAVPPKARQSGPRTAGMGAVAASTARRVTRAPNGTISIGSGNRPETATSFD